MVKIVIRLLLEY